MQTRSAAGKALRPSRRVASRQIRTRSSLRVRTARQGAMARAGGDASAAGLGCSRSPVGCGEAERLSLSRNVTRGLATQDEMRPWRASEDSLPYAVRSVGSGRVASDAEGVGADALLPPRAASAAGIFKVQTMAVLGLVDRGLTRAPLQRVARRTGSGHQ